ncbi:hypothetical protein CPB83DRAFT_116841 [Crepidotus variabilis]|uniref:Uncharacterized protein n=1 Tax=Crepidotus variabilis TaxID=179855 RepID=A0A9P6E4C9_9AGAR|nr:hypothetical protein CPB83DRAFT_116841 [Crepidotus variabilis]
MVLSCDRVPKSLLEERAGSKELVWLPELMHMWGRLQSLRLTTNQETLTLPELEIRRARVKCVKEKHESWTEWLTEYKRAQPFVREEAFEKVRDQLLIDMQPLGYPLEDIFVACADEDLQYLKKLEPLHCVLKEFEDKVKIKLTEYRRERSALADKEIAEQWLRGRQPEGFYGQERYEDIVLERPVRRYLCRACSSRGLLRRFAFQGINCHLKAEHGVVSIRPAHYKFDEDGWD